MADYFDSGFTVRERSWHGKENLLTEAPETWDDARLAAGLMWEPRLVPLYYMADDGSFVLHEQGQRVERDDTGFGLGTVSGTFEIITHAEMGKLMEPVLAQPGCKLDTMGSVREGRQVYATVLLDEPYTIPGDVDGFGDAVITLPYFAILNSHDGTGACKGLFTQVRVVCANTVQASAADGDRHGAQFSLRHTSGAKARLEEARNIVEQCRYEAEKWREIGTVLAATAITDDQQMQFLDAWIPVPELGKRQQQGMLGEISQRQVDNVLKDRARFLHVLRDSATNMETQHTALGLFNAAVEWADHLRGFRSNDTLLSRQILRAEPVKTEALKLVRKVAQVA